MYLVVGITGNVGGGAARLLLDGGHKVRALVRDPAKAAAWADKGVELCVGDIGDAKSIARALQGVQGAFVMLPPHHNPVEDWADYRQFANNYRDAITQVPPRRVVVLSSFGSEKTKGLGLITATHILETALADVQPPVAFIRAGGFLENNLSSFARARESGFFDTFYVPTDRPLACVATEDISKLAARLLLSEWSGKRYIEHGTGFSPDELARAMSEAAGRRIQARAIAEEQWPAVLARFGLPPAGVKAYCEMLRGVNAGWIAMGQPGTEPVAAATTPAVFFAKAVNGAVA